MIGTIVKTFYWWLLFTGATSAHQQSALGPRTAIFCRKEFIITSVSTLAGISVPIHGVRNHFYPVEHVTCNMFNSTCQTYGNNPTVWWINNVSLEVNQYIQHSFISMSRVQRTSNSDTRLRVPIVQFSWVHHVLHPGKVCCWWWWSSSWPSQQTCKQCMMMFRQECIILHLNNLICLPHL